MTNTKHTKRALLSSLMVLLLCVTMLIGSTFAWFTDTATTSVNTITAGNLDVQLLDANGDTLEGKTLGFVDSTGAPANYMIEPNGTYKLQPVTVKNNGNLNLKYKVQITGIDGNAELLKVLSWEYILDGKTATVNDGTEFHLGAADSHTLTIQVTMDDAAGNEYKNKTLSGVAINILATQDVGDNDSFMDNYDESAAYPAVPGSSTGGSGTEPEGPTQVVAGSVAELQQAFEDAASGSGDMIITLSKDFDAANSWTAFSPKGYNGVNKIVIEGNGKTIKNLNQPLMVGSFAGSGSITIRNLTIENANISGARYNDLGLGAFVAYSDSSGGVILENCKLVNSKVECTDGYAGGLIGYASTPVTVIGCSVTGSTIQGANSSGAVIGHAEHKANVSGSTFTGNTIRSTDDSWRVGVVAGTINTNGAGSIISGITQSGNTLDMGAVVKPEGQNDLIGRNYANIAIS